MKSKVMGLAVAAAFVGGSVAALTPEEAFELAVNAGVCGDAGVGSAIITDANTIEVTCGEFAAGNEPFADVEALFPAAAGPVAAAAGGFLLLLAAGGGGSTSDTQ